MIRGATVELPESADAKLSELQMARDTALDAARGATARLQSLPRDADQRMRERLVAEQSKYQHRQGQLAQLVSRVNQWAVELRLPPSSTLAHAPALDVAVKPGLTLGETIAAVREDVAGVQRDMARVRSAPLKRTSQREAINKYLAGLSLRARPRVGFDARGNAKVLWAEDMVANKDDLLGVLAFVFGPQAVASAFSRDLELEPERTDAVTPAEREERLADLMAQLLELERREECLIERAVADGSDVLRRPDASPAAVLGVAVVAKEVQPSAA
jgi:hypothetical protein